MSWWQLQYCVWTSVMNSDAKASREVLVIMIYFGSQGWDLQGQASKQGNMLTSFTSAKLIM